MFDLTHLPRTGKLRIYATADYITEESAAEGDAKERGWVNSLDALPQGICESRNDVEPLAEFVVAELNGKRYVIDQDTWTEGGDWDDAQDQVLSDIRDILEELGGHDSDDGSTIYGHREQEVQTGDGGVMTYAIHAHVKHYGAGRGWVEDDIDILTGLFEGAEA
jgi:hypothetical protein